MYGATFRAATRQTPAAVTTNKNIKLRSFKSSESIQKKEGGLESTVTNNQFSLVTLNDLAMNAREREREHTIISSFGEAVNPMLDVNSRGVKIAHFCLEFMSLNL